MPRQHFPDSELSLLGLNNNQVGTIHRIEHPTVMGRSKRCDVVLTDIRASRQQARFSRGPSASLYVEDLGSSNGTFINGRQITRQGLREDEARRVIPKTICYCLITAKYSITA